MLSVYDLCTITFIIQVVSNALWMQDDQTIGYFTFE